jgi:IS5 family transposase
MIQNGLFDLHIRFNRLDERNGDPLSKLNQVINWELFRPTLESVFEKERKSNAGAKGFDKVMLFKCLILQSLYNLSDEALEFQILDRLSFTRFLSIEIGDKVPDATTIWRFREELTGAGVVESLFRQFDFFLRQNGFQARAGQIIDASIVSAPKQRNNRAENKQIKQGDVPDNWHKAKKRQKDVDARWVKKNGRSFFGYKNHLGIDAQHKLIRAYAVTDAAVHDSQVFFELLDAENTSRDVWADSAYRAEDTLTKLKQRGYREHLQRKGCRHRKLTEWEKQGNRTRAKRRARIEHVFGVQTQKAGNLLVRTIGIMRARTKIGLRNLAYNLDRYRVLVLVAG